MSIFSSIIKTVANVGKSILPIASMAPGPIGSIAKVGMAAGVIGGIGKIAPRVLPGIGKIGAKAYPLLKKYGGTAVTGGLAGMQLYDMFGNPVKKKSKRMNPMNYKALNRALRRIKSAKKLADKIECVAGKMPVKRKTRSC